MENIDINIQVVKKQMKIESETVETKINKISKAEMNEILRAHYFAQNTIHIVGIKDSKKYRNDYVGTSFIYKQMVFNMIYDKFGNNDSSAKEKINNLVKWMVDNNVKTTEIVEEITDTELESLKNIVVDRTIRQIKKDSFLAVIQKIKNRESLSNEEVSNVFIFINNVRNNFFHGTKKAQEALEKGQNERLNIYSRFLSKLSSEFIKLIENKGVELNKASLLDDLKENLGLLTR